MSKEGMEMKTMDMATLDNAAEKAGMSVHEFTELALYWLMDMCEVDKDFGATDGRVFLHSSRKEHGYFPPVFIGVDQPTGSAARSMMEDLGESIGLDRDEIPTFCLQWLSRMAQNAPHAARETAKAWKESRTEAEYPLHPLMHRLFSGDLKAVHGPTFGDLASDDVGAEHHFMTTNLERIFAMADWEDSFSHLMSLETVIRHCPALKNEAAVIRSLLEAEQLLIRFNNAVNAA